MEKFFKLKENNTSVKTEILAGITTFLAMAYILAVNPSMLGLTGMNTGSVFTATALSSAIATVVMAILTNYPIALAPGMGLNAYFAFTVCLGELEGIENPWQIALTAVLIEGIIFILLSTVKFRETILNNIPTNIKHGITTGIGLFITLTGLQNASITVYNSSTILTLGDLGSISVILTFIGVILIGAMIYYKIKGAILWGILAIWGLGIIAQICGVYTVNEEIGLYSLIPQISSISDFMPQSLAPTFMKFNFAWVADNVLKFSIIVFSLLFVDLFDTVGTLVGVAEKGNLLDKKGNLPKAGRALSADAIGTVAGACLGTSTVSSYIESSAGVADGGKTGLTALTTAVLFILSLFLWPIFKAIPNFATAPALIIVGLFMMSSVLKMKFDGDIADALGGFMAIIMMPFTYSIANGIMFSILTWIVLKLIEKKQKDIHPIIYIISALFVLRILYIILQ